MLNKANDKVLSEPHAYMYEDEHTNTHEMTDEDERGEEDEKGGTTKRN